MRNLVLVLKSAESGIFLSPYGCTNSVILLADIQKNIKKKCVISRTRVSRIDKRRKRRKIIKRKRM